MRVLIVHRYFWPETMTILAGMLRELAQDHVARGDEVHVVCGTARPEDRALWEAELGAGITWQAFDAPIDRESSMMGRGKNTLRLFGLALRALFGQSRFDVMYVVSYPPAFAGALALVARATGRVGKVIYYLQDNFVYRVPTAVGKAIYRRYHRMTLALAWRTVTISEEMKAELLNMLPSRRQMAAAARIKVVTNPSPDLSEPMPEDHAKSVDIIYAGNHGRAQNLYAVLDILAHPDMRDHITTSFFGGGTEAAGLEAHAKAISSPVVFHGSVPREQATAEIARARFGLVGAMPDLMRYAFPSKLAGYAAMGTKSLVMCDPCGALAEWLEETGIGFAIDANDPERARVQLLALFESGAADYDADALRKTAQKMFSMTQYREAMADILAEAKA